MQIDMAAAGDEVPLAMVRYARNFARSLESIEAFLIETGFPDGYDRLLDSLEEVVVRNLQRHPRIGRLFLERNVDSIEAERLSERIRARLLPLAAEAQLREYVMDDYLVLYAHLQDSMDEPGVVQLLAIKHQKQLGFDVPSER